MHLQDIVPCDEPLEQSASQIIPVRYDMSLRMTSIQKQLVSNIKHLQVKGTTAKQCRICLQSDQHQSKLIKPCKCIGSIQYGHVDCLKEWIKRKIEMNSKIKARCEVCDTQYNYRLESQRQFDCSLLTKHYQKQKRGLVCFGVIYGMLLLLFIAFIPLTIASNYVQNFFLNHIFNFHREAIIITISCLVIYGITLFVVGVLFVSEYMIKEVLVVGDVSKYRESITLAKNYKIFFRR